MGGSKMAEITSRGERTRSEIITSAYRLFLERGYHGSSMREIAREAGIAVSGIYNHFATKEELFLAVLLAYHPYRLVFPAINAAQGETVEEFVQDAAKRMVEKTGNRQEILHVMFIELVEFNGRHLPRLFEEMLPLFSTFGQRFMQTEGKLRSIPPPILWRAFLGFFFSYIMVELLSQGKLPAELKENALEHFIDIFLHGIMASN
jgi:AcrR family transcriptional regulator